MVPIFSFTQPSISYKPLGSPCTLIYGRFCCFLRLHLNACNSFKNGWILDFENAAVRYNVGLLYHAKNHSEVPFGMLKVRFCPIFSKNFACFCVQTARTFFGRGLPPGFLTSHENSCL